MSGGEPLQANKGQAVEAIENKPTGGFPLKHVDLMLEDKDFGSNRARERKQ
jgi:hypothetical protein